MTFINRPENEAAGVACGCGAASADTIPHACQRRLIELHQLEARQHDQGKKYSFLLQNRSEESMFTTLNWDLILLVSWGQGFVHSQMSGVKLVYTFNVADLWMKYWSKLIGQLAVIKLKLYRYCKQELCAPLASWCSQCASANPSWQESQQQWLFR